MPTAKYVGAQLAFLHLFQHLDRGLFFSVFCSSHLMGFLLLQSLIVE